MLKNKCIIQSEVGYEYVCGASEKLLSTLPLEHSSQTQGQWVRFGQEYNFIRPARQFCIIFIFNANGWQLLSTENT